MPHLASKHVIRELQRIQERLAAAHERAIDAAADHAVPDRTPFISGRMAAECDVASEHLADAIERLEADQL